MAPFLEPVSRYMSSAVDALPASAPLTEVARHLSDRRISAVPLLDHDGRIVGVVSRSDLLHAGRFEAIGDIRGVALRLPTSAAISLVTRKPHVCAASTTLRDAAREMVAHRIHRLFVVDDGRPTGVFSTLDLAAAVRDARTIVTIGEIMKHPILTIPLNGALDAAISVLDRAHITGLVVVDEHWPIGVFTQAEAMAARDLPAGTPIEDLYDPAVLCMPVRTPVHRAAAQAAQFDARRVVACDRQEAVGIVSGLDFAELAAA
jgi:CBS domain-containing protein